MFNRGRYELQIFDIRTKHILQSQRFILKVNALDAFEWHRKITSTGFMYLLIDRRTGEEVAPSLTYNLLKGHNV